MTLAQTLKGKSGFGCGGVLKMFGGAEWGRGWGVEEGGEGAEEREEGYWRLLALACTSGPLGQGGSPSQMPVYRSPRRLKITSSSARSHG